jgi:hypothetical protein
VFRIMASIIEKAIFSDIGAVWAFFVAKWNQYVEGATFDLGFTYTDISWGGEGYRASIFIISDGTDDHEFWCLIANAPIYSGYGRNAVHDAIASRGMDTMPAVSTRVVGARDNYHSWTTKAWEYKKQLVKFATGYDTFDTVISVRYQYDGGTLTGVQTATFLTQTQAAVMTQLVSMKGETPGEWYPSGDVPAETAAQVGAASAASGGGTVDLTPLVDAVDNLSFVDQTFTINNGADMFTVRGRIRVS